MAARGPPRDQRRARRRPGYAARAQRREGVVGRLAGPDKVPERIAELIGGELGVLHEQVGEEAGAAGQAFPQQVVGRALRAFVRGGRRAEQGRVVAEVQRDAPGAPAQGPRPHPRQLTVRAELVEPRRRIGAEAAGQDVALPQLGRQGHTLQRDQHLTQPVRAGARRGVTVHALPGGREARQGRLADRLDLLAQRRQRRAPQATEHVRVAPLALRAQRSQLATHELTGLLQGGECRPDVHAVARPHLARLERAVRAGETAHELQQGIGHVGQEGLGQTPGRHDAQGVAIEPGVLGREPALLAADAGADGAALALEQCQPGPRLPGRLAALRRLALRQLADPAQHVVQAVGAARPQVLRTVLQVVLHLLQRGGVDEVAQLLLAEQLTQQVTVQGQGHGAPLGRRGVALVHVRRDVVEEQRRGERRRGLRLDLDDRELPRAGAVAATR